MNENPNWQGKQQQDQQYGQGPYRQQPYQPQYQPVYHKVNVKDFTRSAWIAAGLGGLCAFPGLVMAIIYLREALGIKKSTGVVPQGYGCLWAVFLVCAILMLPILLVLSALVVGLIHTLVTQGV